MVTLYWSHWHTWRGGRTYGRTVTETKFSRIDRLPISHIFAHLMHKTNTINKNDGYILAKPKNKCRQNRPFYDKAAIVNPTVLKKISWDALRARGCRYGTLEFQRFLYNFLQC